MDEVGCVQMAYNMGKWYNMFNAKRYRIKCKTTAI